MRLVELLETVPREIERRVVDAKNRSNQILRQALKDETRLHFRSGAGRMDLESNVQIPIEVRPGLPEELQDLEVPKDMDFLLELARLRPLLEAMRADWNDLGALNERIVHIQERSPIGALDGERFARFRDWAERLLDYLDRRDPAKLILNVGHDVLGIYDYSGDLHGYGPPGKIVLYWGAIGLVAKTINVDVETLTTVVLAHELAHAYTHLGADIDGVRWETQRFAASEVHLKEGLAQYYCRLALERGSMRFPRALDAMDELCKRQGPAYHVHERWIGLVSPEDVRQALRMVRGLSRAGVGEFEREFPGLHS